MTSSIPFIYSSPIPKIIIWPFHLRVHVPHMCLLPSSISVTPPVVHLLQFYSLLLRHLLQFVPKSISYCIFFFFFLDFVWVQFQIFTYPPISMLRFRWLKSLLLLRNRLRPEYLPLFMEIQALYGVYWIWPVPSMMQQPNSWVQSSATKIHFYWPIALKRAN